MKINYHVGFSLKNTFCATPDLSDYLGSVILKPILNSKLKKTTELHGLEDVNFDYVKFGDYEFKICNRNKVLDEDIGEIYYSIYLENIGITVRYSKHSDDGRNYIDNVEEIKKEAEEWGDRLLYFGFEFITQW